MAQLKWGQRLSDCGAMTNPVKSPMKKSKIGKCPKVKTEYDDFHELFRLYMNSLSSIQKKIL